MTLLDRGRLRHLMRAALALALAAAVIAGCGGGVGVGGTGAFASGPITGFGSVFVNGIEFDDAAARIEDEDGAAAGREQLRLGMTVEVDSGPLGGTAGAPTANASRIRIASDIVGPVGAVDLPGARLVVFGQVVRVTAATVYDDDYVDGLASVASGSVVEVYGRFDVVAGGFVAARIAPRPDAQAYKLRGFVRELDTAARRFTMGLRRFDYSALPAAAVPPDLADGRFLRLRVARVPVAGVWTVLAFGEGAPRVPDAERVLLRGRVTAFASAASFSVDGQAVDARGASFPAGTAGLGLGAEVEVDGASVDGVVQARAVRVRDDSERESIELKGRVERLDPAARTLVLRGVTVSYAGASITYEGGSEADLRVGVALEVQGVLSPDGTRVQAQHIHFED